MRNAIVVDSSAIWAFFDSGDQHYEASASCFDDLFSSSLKLLITDFVFNEVVTGLRMRAGLRQAVAAGESLRSGGRFIRISADDSTWNAAWDIFQDYDDLKLSFTDCHSAAVMRRLGIDRIFTFDRDFAILGFEMIPRR